MNSRKPPIGQAMVEVLVVAGLLLSCLVLIRAAQIWAQERADAVETMRLHAEWCRQLPSNCAPDKLKLLLQEPVQVARQGAQTQRANAQGLKDWASSLRALASISAEKIFSLPDGNPLQVVHADFQFPRSRALLDSRPESLRLSVIPHDWRAISALLAADRIREGSEPVNALASVVEAAHAPSLYVLMPATDLLGMDEHTQTIRERFHRLDPLAPAQSLREVSP